MSAHSPHSPNLHPSKRPRQSSPDKDSPTSLPSAGATSPTGDLLHDGQTGHGPGKVGQSSSFRNVSACNRCRLRKNRCDQKLPSCASCDKAGVACVGYDPITKREIPRSYIFYLESRIEQLETLLTANSIAFPTAHNLEYCSKPGNVLSAVRSPVEAGHPSHADPREGAGSTRAQNNGDDASRLQRLVSKSNISGIPGAANPRFLGSISGVSFARVVFAAVQSSVSDSKSTSDKGGIRPYKPLAGNVPGGIGGTSMRDSFFGLHTKPTIHPAVFPSRALGQKLVSLYFEHANPQIPVLHKGEFMEMFEQAYAEEGRVRGPRELYVLNMVFAIGGGIILGDSAKTETDHPPSSSGGLAAGSKQSQPEEYHASAIVHLEACLGSGGGLEELQAVLLLANFALLRPVPPGLWYIIGVAVRLAVDLGLHYEDGKDIDAGLVDTASQQGASQGRERGRREYVRDLRRRLWWCTYSFDRLVSVCVGRPFGISDQVITTEFPSLLEDRYITPNGFLEPPADIFEPTYKLVAHHYFRLRLLQSEILQVLQFQQTQAARDTGLNQRNPHMHTTLPSPFLSRFDSFRSWRIDIDKRLWEWKGSAPTKKKTGVAFSTEFFDLNYWQAIIMLYRQSLSVPAMFEGEYHTAKEVNSPPMYNVEPREDEDRVYLKVAEAGQKILRLYRQLHRVGLVNYTYLATHHLFMAGISYLYAIWHSPIVRSRLTVDEVDFTILAAKSVFTDLIEKCPPAEACRDAFDRTAKATIRMANSTGGFGQSLSDRGVKRSDSRDSIDYRMDWGSRSDTTSVSSKIQQQQQQQQPLSHHRHRRPHAPSTEQMSARRSQYEVSSDVYSNSASPTSQFSAFQKGQYHHIKSDPDGFSLMRNLPAQPRSTTSSDGHGPLSPAEVAAVAAAATIDPLLMPSPTVAQHPTPPSMGSPITTIPPLLTGGSGASYLSQQQQPQQQGGTIFSPGAMGYDGSMQGLDFLQNLDAASGSTGLDGDLGLGSDAVVDFGFGLGWEGMHHDFSDGQQVDLFDGFFFGGQQGGGGMGNGSNGGM
ncbi:fungal-specific transcription factor domain-containing protein [Podospora appendiculata]|uniref:Fungal-specific transcription factor domain-containing protein n=1 Tax=Podospora appendiculata TaxID=314037 RepID=A0AAE1CCG0_9PEZI|nr:fungal-specific transcription factor domain-containing protein [Podospora appendiculata]